MLKADGTKFGKTESGTVWLDPARTSPYQLYQFFLRTEDAVVGTYLRYFTFLPHERDHRRSTRATAEHPERREAQRELARQVCTLVHGPAETERAEQAAAALFGEEVERRSTSAPSSTCSPRRRPPPSRASRLDDGGVPLVDLLAETGILSVEEPGPTDGGAGGRLRQQPPRGRRRACRSGPDDLVRGTATWCCAGASATTTCVPLRLSGPGVGPLGRATAGSTAVLH